MVVGVAPLIKVFLGFIEVAIRDGSLEDFDLKGAVEAFAFTLGLRVIGTAVDDIDT